MTITRSDQATRSGITKVALKHVTRAIIVLIAVWFLFIAGEVVFHRKVKSKATAMQS